MPTLNIMQTLKAVQSATIDARNETGMQGISTRVERGQFQVVNVTFSGKSTIVDELSDWVSPLDAVAILRQIAADKAFRT